MKKNTGLCHELNELLESFEDYVFLGTQPAHIQGELEVDYKSKLASFENTLKSMERTLKLKYHMDNKSIDGIINIVERDTYFLVQIESGRAAHVLDELGYTIDDHIVRNYVHNNILRVDKYLL